MIMSHEKTSSDRKPFLTAWFAFLTAVQFLTVFPPIIRRPFTPSELGRSVGFYPVVGLLLGIILVGSRALLILIFPKSVCLALILALWIIASGALHLDGFLDTCDGVLGGRDAQNRLEIMRDERLGAFAFAGGILLILLKYTTLTSIGNVSEGIILATTLSHWSMALAITFFPYARPTGIGRDIKNMVRQKDFILATIFTLLVLIVVNPWEGLICFIAITVMVYVVSKLMLRLLGGLTGDIYGTINELSELLVLLILCSRVAI
jgi:adenosylcobinamide-GDP ribazoletransferase